MEIVWVTNFTQVRIHLLSEQKYLFGRAFTSKDGYSDTMGIGIIVLDFCPKPLEMAEFLTLLKKHRL